MGYIRIFWRIKATFVSIFIYSSLSSPPYWLLPPLKASTQLDMLAMVVFTELALLVLDMVAMLEDMPVLDMPVLDTLVLLTMP